MPPTTPTPGLKTPQVINPPPGAVRVAPRAFVSVGFSPPSNPLKVRSSIHHAVHWNKLREMLRPYGWEEVPGSAVILGDGDGSIITFSTRGEPVLPQPVQDWLKKAEPKGFEVAAKIAAGAAQVLGVIAKLFGVPKLGVIAAGATVVLEAVKDAVED